MVKPQAPAEEPLVKLDDAARVQDFSEFRITEILFYIYNMMSEYELFIRSEDREESQR